jgi:hypothetical protein
MEHNSTKQNINKEKTMLNINGQVQQEEKTSFEHRHHYLNKFSKAIDVLYVVVFR